jgi:hypothetical protein
MYDWKGSFRNNVVDEAFMLGLFHLLEEGQPYTDVSGAPMGHVSVLDGPVDLIQIIADSYLEVADCEYKRINVIYKEKIVFQCFIVDEECKIKSFTDGRWVEFIRRYGKQED